MNATLIAAPPAQDEGPLSHGALTLQPAQHAAAFDGRPLDLTAVEFAILKALLSRASAVFSRSVWPVAR